MENYKIASSRILYEVLEGEIIIVDFETGSYFSLAQTAKSIWLCLEQKASLDSLIEAFADYYHIAKDQIFTDVQAFIEQLLGEDVIEIDNETVDRVVFSQASWKLPYIPPLLQKFTDVQNLLLIDPIHEVAEAGWPHQP